jgi:chemotaxis protein CheZ
MSDFDRAGDSIELEALFDSIAASGCRRRTRPVPTASARPSLLQQLREGEPAAEDSDRRCRRCSIRLRASAGRCDRGQGERRRVARVSGNEKVFRRVGQMARQLHDTLGELGYHELLGTAAAAIPDTRDRLNYVASLTEKAACRVLNATDIANPLQDQLEASSAALAAKWDALYANQMGVEEFKKLADDTRAFLKQGLPQHTAATKAQLLEIMMAQDFQDLTGQVIKKTIAVAQELEAQLMGVLIETMPGERRTESVMSLLNGPVINAEGRSDVVATQQQVDDLLGSLGF